MELYNIYAGLGGGFGGASYEFTSKFDSKEEAENCAYEQAVQCYEMYAGSHGLDCLDDCINEALESGEFPEDTPRDDDELLDYAGEVYMERVEGWLNFFVIETSKDINTERLKKEKIYKEW